MMIIFAFLAFVNARAPASEMQCESTIPFYIQRNDNTVSPYKNGVHKIAFSQVFAILVNQEKNPWVTIYPRMGIDFEPPKIKTVRVHTDGATYFEVFDIRSKDRALHLSCRLP
jgi:hypothetical protein